MKKLLLSLSLLLMATVVAAKPAKPGLWQTLRLTDGTEVRACLVGDEHGHYWRAADGTAYRVAANGETYVPVDAKAVAEHAKQRRQHSNARRTMRMAQRRLGGQSAYLGKKRGIIILVNFKDKSFKTTNNKALYERITNEKGFSQGSFKGSMADYFLAQSRGLFELDFDLVGPVKVSQNYSYYGRNDADGNDQHPEEMVAEAVALAKGQVDDWSVYDWDGDGEIDQVYFIYAGYGEADTYNKENTIWPHAATLAEYAEYGYGDGPITVAQGLKVNTYACSSELNGSGQVDGIGTICHEFSHCLGYPDYYDIDYSGGQGMGNWDLMCAGSYNGDGYQPAGYTSYERWTAGWEEPIVLDEEDVNVENMASLQNGGESYVIYNKAHTNEFFLLENRQKEGWDASLPGAGLLILHVDYDEKVWAENTPNDNPSRQRMTWIPADNKYDYTVVYGEKSYTWEGMATDTYPYKQNNAFNKTTAPAAKFYNKTDNGTYFMASSVENIRQNADNTVSFSFVADMDKTVDPEDPEEPLPSGALFYESFNKCNGKGGNDGQWNGSAANALFVADNNGWETVKAFGGSKCAKFGTSTVDGEATTPAIKLSGNAQLTFKAGAWNHSYDSQTLNLSVEGGSISPTTVTMTKGEFNAYTATVKGSGSVTITFAAEKGRFFLDDVLLTSVATGIESVATTTTTDRRIYTLDGRYMGTDLHSLSPGLYIVGGKKVVK